MKKEKVHKKHQDERIFIAGSLEATGIADEYERKCCFCKRTIFLADDWSDKKDTKFICTDCVQQGKAGGEPKFKVTEQTVNRINRECSMNIEANDLADLAKKNLSPTRKQK
jgi:hypothetical protein